MFRSFITIYEKRLDICKKEGVKMDYYTIDFETANEMLTSACSIGICGVENKKIVFEKYYLINPEEYFSPFNIMIHNIKEEDVKDAPNFQELWDEIKIYFDNTIVFSHNASFDFTVLKCLFEKYKISKPTFHFGCTVKIARGLWNDRELPNHKLDTVAKYLGIEFNHHHALNDARVCVDIINAGLKMYQVYDVCELYQNLSLKFGYLGPDNYYNTFKLPNRYRKGIKICGDSLKDKLLVISGNPKQMKKKEFLYKVIENGGYIDTKVSNKCDYFVMLNGYDGEKLEQVELLIKQGINIKILTEEMILEMVK